VGFCMPYPRQRLHFTGRVLEWAALLLLLAGAVGAVLGSAPDDPVVAAETPSWIARSRDGVTLRADGRNGLVITPGDELAVKDSVSSLGELRLRLERFGTQSCATTFTFRESDSGHYRLLVVPGPTLTVALSAQLAGERARMLGSFEDDTLPLDSLNVFELALQLDGPAFQVSLNGRPVLDARDDTLESGGCHVRADGIRVRKVSLSGLDARGQPFSDAVSVSELPAIQSSLWTRAVSDGVTIFAIPVAAFLAMSGLLRVLPRAGPAAARLRQATLLALAPVAGLCASQPLTGWSAPSLLLVLAVAAGTVGGLAWLAAGTPAAAPRSALRAFATGVLLAVLCAAAAMHEQAARVHQHMDIARKRAGTTKAAPWSRAGTARLDAGSALSTAGPYGSLVLTCGVELEPASWLEVRLRAHAAASPEGVALFLGSDDRMATGFVVESREYFRPVGRGCGPLPAGRPLALKIRVHGGSWTASVNDRVIAEASQLDLPAGGVVLLTAAGAATVTDLMLVPEPVEAAAAVPAIPALQALAAAPLAFAAWVALALAGIAFLAAPAAVAFELSGWALAPIALTLALAGDPDLDLQTWLTAGAGGVAILLAAALLRGRRGIGLLLPAAGAAVLIWTLPRVAGPPVVGGREVTGLVTSRIDVPYLAPGLAHLQHPKLRFLNDYLVEHAFRNRRFTLQKPPGTLRIACLGTSTTWGYGMDDASGQDYPAFLQRLLDDRVADVAVEVINAGVRGWTAPRMRRFFDEVVAGFQPDIVTVSLFFNDSRQATICNEDETLALLSEARFDGNWWTELRESLELNDGLTRLRRVTAKLPDTQADSEAAWRSLVTASDEPHPLERFESSLRDVAMAVRATGAELILIKEPTRTTAPILWKKEFYAAIDRVGADFGAEVLDVEPALRAAGGDALFMDDVHLFARGNRVVAEQLAPPLAALIRKRAASMQR